MPHHGQAYAARQRARFMLPDGLKFVRPDAARFLKPGTDPADVFPALASHRKPRRRDGSGTVFDAVAVERAKLDELRGNLVQIKSELAWRRLVHAIALKYSASQPRVPAGSGRESGRWTSDGDGSGSGVGDSDATSGSPLDAFAQATDTGEMLDEIVVDGSDVNPAFDDADAGTTSAFESDRPSGMTDTRVVSDADPEVIRSGEQYAQLDKITDSTGRPYYERDGHHYLPKAVYRKWNLRPETRRIFENATSGKISGTVRTNPDGVPMGNYWTGENGPHGRYNAAVRELSESFLRRLDISPEDMTVQQALDLLAEIRNSQDPRIADFNRAIRMLRRIFRFRIERGE